MDIRAWTNLNAESVANMVGAFAQLGCADGVILNALSFRLAYNCEYMWLKERSVSRLM